MKHLLLILIFFMTNFSEAYSQTSFEQLGDKMFFNIYIRKVDSSIYEAVKKYVPSLIQKIDSSGWTIYSPKSLDYENPLKVKHVIFFSKHPFFDIEFDEGAIEFTTLESDNFSPRFSEGVLWFAFKNKSSAEQALSDLVREFTLVSKAKKNINKDGKKIMLFTNEKSIKASNCVQFILTKDEIYNGRYKLYFTIGATTYPEKFYEF